MQFTALPNELVLHIYQSCTDIPSVLNLASTCHHFRKVLSLPRRLPTLYLAAEAQFGPLSSAMTLVTHNTSQPPHLPRPSPPHSLALLTRLLAVGRVANQWANLYPFQKWRGPQSSSRRLLNSTERHRLRRACYRLWLYSLAFHTPMRPRTTRLSPPAIRSRAALLRSWPTDHLAQMLDLYTIFRNVVQTHICPSNALVMRRHKARFPDDPYPSRFHASHHPPGFPQAYFHSTPHVSKLLARSRQDTYGFDGWGDEIAHYYVVEDMLKLDPGQLMWLYNELTCTSETNEACTASLTGTAYPVNGGYAGGKTIVERFVAGLGGEWFENNGETFVETAALVVGDRGEEVKVLKERVEDKVEGIVKEGEVV